MTQQDKEFYDALLEMFTNSKGWKHLQKEAERELEMEQKAWQNIGSSEKFWEAKGRMQVLTRFSNLERIVRHTLEQEEESANV